MVQQFIDWQANRHDYAKAWKKKNKGKVFGYFCTYMPEEVLYAAGVLPVRILGSHEPQNVTEPHIFAMFCPFCRDCLAQGLKGRYDYLDGIGIAQSCLHIRQAYTSWTKHIPTEFSYYLNMPHKVQSKRANPFLRGEIEDFVKAVEKWTGKKITDANLKEAITVYNNNRRLMRELYELRKADKPPITGTEAMYITMAMQMTDKVEHSKALERLIKDLKNKKVERDPGARLMVVGSENDDTKFLNMVESCGSTIVVDDHCTGSRYFWNDVKDGKDTLQAIADRYIERPPCPTKDWEERKRLPHILKLAKDWRAQGAILVQQKFCDPHELDMVALKKFLTANGIPCLQLELDVTVPIGQFKIRVEAFLEIIRGEELF
jgi:benzoyl-CoA reductase subunit C